MSDSLSKKIQLDKRKQLKPEDYCREIEAYLCRKNDGHLVRIVGPSFNLVCGWALRGVPMSVACQGIDRYFERYYAGTRRRRPARIDFCEHDVLHIFDEWKKAVGVWPDVLDSEQVASQGNQVSVSLRTHLDRVAIRLNSLVDDSDKEFSILIKKIVQTLEDFRLKEKPLRGELKKHCLLRLEELDSKLLKAVREKMTDLDLDKLRGEAESELRGFRSRLTKESYERSVVACIDRLVRERAKLPILTFE